ncbi:hypothetical protein BV911_11275 [Pseudoruegeria sp. SK021]|nr:hypothetical protein BV911_11275 [Pseudoruegeria sp. SK021]
MPNPSTNSAVIGPEADGNRAKTASFGLSNDGTDTPAQSGSARPEETAVPVSAQAQDTPDYAMTLVALPFPVLPDQSYAPHSLTGSAASAPLSGQEPTPAAVDLTSGPRPLHRDGAATVPSASGDPARAGIVAMQPPGDADQAAGRGELPQSGAQIAATSGTSTPLASASPAHTAASVALAAHSTTGRRSAETPPSAVESQGNSGQGTQTLTATAAAPTPAPTAASGTGGMQGSGSGLAEIMIDTDQPDPGADNPALSDPIKSEARSLDPLRPESQRADASRPEIARQVGQQLIDGLRQRRDGAIEISLSPEELGRVRMILQGSEGRMHLTIQSERADTEGLMRRHIAELQAEFRDQGYADVSFSFGKTGSDGSPQPGTTDAQTDGGRDGAQPQTDPHRAALVPSTSPLNAYGGLDLRL